MKTDGEEKVLFWDGREYAPEYLDSRCPGLADYANAHPILEEWLPDSRRHALWCLLRGICLGILACDAIIVVSMGTVDNMQDLLIHGIVPLNGLFFLGFMLMCPLALLAGPRRICIARGLVGVPIPRSPIANCLWYRGPMRRTQFRRRDGGVTLIIPLFRRVPARMPYFVIRQISWELPCGFEPAAANRIMAFLEIAGIPELQQQKRVKEEDILLFP